MKIAKCCCSNTVFFSCTSREKRCPVVTCCFVKSKPTGSAVLAHPRLYVVCVFCMKTYSMLCWYRHLLCYTAMFAEQDVLGLLGNAVLRRHRAQQWWWAWALSWSGSSWSDGEWPSPGPRHAPWVLKAAWLVPAWHWHCWSAARKYDQSKWLQSYWSTIDLCCDDIRDF